MSYATYNRPQLIIDSRVQQQRANSHSVVVSSATPRSIHLEALSFVRRAQVDGRDVVEPRPPGRLLRGARVVDVCGGGFVVWGGRIWIKVRPNVLSKFFSPHNTPPPHNKGIRVVGLVSVSEEERKNCKNYKFCEKQCRARKVACKNSAGPRRVRSTPWAARTSLAPRRAPRRRRDSAYHTSVRRSSDCAGSDR